jgi:tripartite-type tricarboxylate transporter receptor subunit TctC
MSRSKIGFYPYVLNVVVILFTILLFCDHGFSADFYPNRSVRLLVPFSPGGGVDALARIMAPRLLELTGVVWVVDNRGGAGGNIAAETVARAAPDGYTVLMGFNTILTVNPGLYKLNYSVEKDLLPVSMLAHAQYILVVHPSVPATSLKDFIALAKSKPGQLNYASAGIGTAVHLAAELFKSRAGIDMVHLAYKGGGPAAAAVLAGEAQVIFASVASSVAQIKQGKLKGLATTGSQRSKVMPELPTVAESGYPGFDVGSWYALFLPAKTPSPILHKLQTAAHKVVAFDDVQLAMSRQGLEVDVSNAQRLRDKIKSETKVWTELIKSADIKLQ